MPGDLRARSRIAAAAVTLCPTPAAPPAPQALSAVGDEAWTKVTIHGECRDVLSVFCIVREQVEEVDDVVLSFPASNEVRKILLSKGQEAIKAATADTGVRVFVPHLSDTSGAPMTLEGDADRCFGAFEAVWTAVDEDLLARSRRSAVVLVPETSLGLVCGRGGSNLTALGELTGCESASASKRRMTAGDLPAPGAASAVPLTADKVAGLSAEQAAAARTELEGAGGRGPQVGMIRVTGGHPCNRELARQTVAAIAGEGRLRLADACAKARALMAADGWPVPTPQAEAGAWLVAAAPVVAAAAQATAQPAGRADAVAASSRVDEVASWRDGPTDGRAARNRRPAGRGRG